jgi:hypothetical protein
MLAARQAAAVLKAAQAPATAVVAQRVHQLMAFWVWNRLEVWWGVVGGAAGEEEVKECVVCNPRPEEVMLCSGCMAVRHCNRECQTWRTGRCIGEYICKELQAARLLHVQLKCKEGHTFRRVRCC